MGYAAAAAAVLITVYAQYRQSQYQEKVLKAQAKGKDIEAKSAEESAAAEEVQVRRQAAQILGRQRAITAEAGLDPSTGSPLLLELDSVRQAEMEALNVRRSGQVYAQGRRYEGAMARSAAAFESSQRPWRAIAGGIEASYAGYKSYSSGEVGKASSVLREMWSNYGWGSSDPYRSGRRWGYGGRDWY